MNPKRKHTIILFFMMIVSTVLISCNTPGSINDMDITHKDNGEEDSSLAYIKEDGLYYSYLSGEDEIKIHEGSNFEYPLISKSGNYVAYTEEDSLFIYDIKNESYEKIDDEISHYYRAYGWIDDENIIYGSNEKNGLVSYNAKSKEKTEHLDDYFYTGLVVSKDNILYASKIKEWTTEEGNFWLNEGIVQIDLNKYDKNKKEYPVEMVVESRKTTEEEIGTNPIVWNISEDGKYIYIMEKYASGSLSSDIIYLGIYDAEEKTYTVFEDIETLSYKNHLALNPYNNIIGLIQGAGREMIENKEVVLLDINEDKRYNTISFMDKDLVAMTPSFTLDGKKLLCSATKNVLDNKSDKYDSVYDQWDNQPHNIYEYDLETSKVKKITDGENFDFIPMDISNNEILFIRYKGDNSYSLVKLANEKETILIDNLIFSGGIDNYPFGFYGHIDTERGMDIFINKEGA